MQTMIIRADGRTESIKPKANGEFTLQELQAVVNGHIEILTLRKLKVFMVIHEEGKLIGLPLNDIATGYLREDGTYGADYIVGDVLIAQFNQIS